MFGDFMSCYVCGLDKSRLVEELPLLVRHYVCENCGEYYLEPGFRSYVETFLGRYGEGEKDKLFKEIEATVKRNKKVYFVTDFRHPLHNDIPDDFIFVEFDDIFSKLGYTFDDLSSGSDYGS